MQPSSSSSYPTNRVQIQGYNIFVDGQRYIIKGVNYDPTEKGEDHNNYNYNRLYEDVADMVEMGVNTLRIYSTKNLSKLHLDYLYQNNIMVVINIKSGWMDRDYLEKIQKYGDNPAILMWGIGNEIMWNFFYTKNEHGVQWTG